MDALSQTAAQVGLDHSFYYLFALVLCLHFLLRAVYLKPFQHLIERRKQLTEGTSKEAERLVALASEKSASYKSQLKETSARARAILTEAEANARKEESRVLQEAGQKSKSLLQDAYEKSVREREAALHSISGEISTIASGIATKVLGRALN